MAKIDRLVIPSSGMSVKIGDLDLGPFEISDFKISESKDVDPEVEEHVAGVLRRDPITFTMDFSPEERREMSFRDVIAEFVRTHRTPATERYRDQIQALREEDRRREEGALNARVRVSDQMSEQLRTIRESFDRLGDSARAAQIAAESIRQAFGAPVAALSEQSSADYPTSASVNAADVTWPEVEGGNIESVAVEPVDPLRHEMLALIDRLCWCSEEEEWPVIQALAELHAQLRGPATVEESKDEPVQAGEPVREVILGGKLT